MLHYTCTEKNSLTDNNLKYFLQLSSGIAMNLNTEAEHSLKKKCYRVVLQAAIKGKMNHWGT